MKKGQNTRGYARYIDFDIHREYILAALVRRVLVANASAMGEIVAVRCTLC